MQFRIFETPTGCVEGKSDEGWDDACDCGGVCVLYLELVLIEVTQTIGGAGAMDEIGVGPGKYTSVNVRCHVHDACEGWCLVGGAAYYHLSHSTTIVPFGPSR